MSTTCPGCGLDLPETGTAISPGQLLAAPECVEVYAEVTGAVLADPALLARWHQTSIDAYTAQHAGPATRPMSVWFALNTLFLVLEQGWTGVQGRAAHARLATSVPRGEWTVLPLPEQRGEVTVQDVALAAGTPGLPGEIERWGRSVWASWAHVHDQVRETTLAQLGGWGPPAG